MVVFDNNDVHGVPTFSALKIKNTTYTERSVFHAIDYINVALPKILEAINAT